MIVVRDPSQRWSEEEKGKSRRGHVLLTCSVRATEVCDKPVLGCDQSCRWLVATRGRPPGEYEGQPSLGVNKSRTVGIYQPLQSWLLPAL